MLKKLIGIVLISALYLGLTAGILALALEIKEEPLAVVSAILLTTPAGLFADWASMKIYSLTN